MIKYLFLPLLILLIVSCKDDPITCRLKNYSVEINSIFPITCFKGDTVTIYGYNLNIDPDNTILKIDEEEVLLFDILEDKIQFIVENEIGEYDISIKIGGFYKSYQKGLKVKKKMEAFEIIDFNPKTVYPGDTLTIEYSDVEIDEEDLAIYLGDILLENIPDEKRYYEWDKENKRIKFRVLIQSGTELEDFIKIKLDEKTAESKEKLKYKHGIISIQFKLKNIKVLSKFYSIWDKTGEEIESESEEFIDLENYTFLDLNQNKEIMEIISYFKKYETKSYELYRAVEYESYSTNDSSNLVKIELLNQSTIKSINFKNYISTSKYYIYRNFEKFDIKIINLDSDNFKPGTIFKKTIKGNEIKNYIDSFDAKKSIGEEYFENTNTYFILDDSFENAELEIIIK